MPLFVVFTMPLCAPHYMGSLAVDTLAGPQQPTAIPTPHAIHPAFSLSRSEGEWCGGGGGGAWCGGGVVSGVVAAWLLSSPAPLVLLLPVPLLGGAQHVLAVLVEGPTLLHLDTQAQGRG